MKPLAYLTIISTTLSLFACTTNAPLQNHSIFTPSPTIQNSNLECQKYKEQVNQCEKYNAEYTGIKKFDKISACLKARGFTQYKSAYCQ